MLWFDHNTAVITRSGFRRNLRVSQIVGLGHFSVDLHSAYNLMYINKPLISEDDSSADQHRLYTSTDLSFTLVPLVLTSDLLL